MKRSGTLAIAVIAAGAGLIFASPARAAGQGERSGDDATLVINALTARTASVSSYSADLTLHVSLHSFPFLSLTIGGNTTYRQPGQYTVTMHTLPMLARALHNVSGDAGDPSVWARKYDIAIDKAAGSGQELVALRMTQKIHGQIDHVEAYVDMATMTVTRIEWYYESGGHIFIDDHYAEVGSMLMVDHQSAEIAMPGVRASATSDISNYVIQSDVASTAR
jgi:hypothetical protein